MKPISGSSRSFLFIFTSFPSRSARIVPVARIPRSDRNNDQGKKQKQIIKKDFLAAPVIKFGNTIQN